MRNIRTLAMGLMAIMLAVSSGCGISRLWKDKKAPAEKKEKTEKADKKEISKAELKLKLKLKEKSIEEKKIEGKNLDKALKLAKQQRRGQQANARDQNPQHPIRPADYRQVPGMLKNLKGNGKCGKGDCETNVRRPSSWKPLNDFCGELRANGMKIEEADKEPVLLKRHTEFVCRRPGKEVWRHMCRPGFPRIRTPHIRDMSLDKKSIVHTPYLPTTINWGGRPLATGILDCYVAPKSALSGYSRYVATGYSGRSRASKRSHRRGHKGRYATRAYVDRKVGALEKKHDDDMAEVRRQQKFFGAEIDKIKDNLGPKTPKGLTRPLKSS